MRAFFVRELRHPSKISLEKNVAEPKAGPNQVLVDVYATGLNFFDVCPIEQLFFFYKSFALTRRYIFQRFCKPRENINRNRLCLSFLAQNSLEEYLRTRPFRLDAD